MQGGAELDPSALTPVNGFAPAPPGGHNRR